MKDNMKKNWIAGAIKRPGALKAKAKAAGGLNKDGNIKPSYLAKAAKTGSPTTKKQATLAMTLKRMSK